MKKTAYQTAAQAVNPTSTPISEPIPGRTMVPNNTGSWGFEVDMWKRLERFLVLGTEGGTYYVGEAKLTRDNAKNVQRCLDTDGKRAVDAIVAVSDAGRAAKNDPALFALAMAVATKNAETRKYALSQLPKVARIGTHLFHFISYIKAMNVGWNRTLRDAVGAWYTAKEDYKLAVQLTKYQSRDSWSHRDVVRLAHPIPKSKTQELALRWAVGAFGTNKHTETVTVKGKQVEKVRKVFNDERFEQDLRAAKESLPLIYAFEEMKRAKTDAQVLKLITDYKLQLEHVPTEKRSKDVFDAILPNLGIEALIRQLPTMTRNGVLGDLGSANTKLVIERLHDEALIKKGRIHPIKVLNALMTYKAGRSLRGDNTWSPIARIVDALDDAFYLSFGAVEPTNKRMLLALDVSGSMSGGPVIGSDFLAPCHVTAAMSMVTARVESDWMIMGFNNGIEKIDITPKMRLDEVIRKVAGINYGGTNISLPMEYARTKNLPVDAFVCYTDNENNSGHRHPIQALQAYQKHMGIPAKLISVATSANMVSIVDDTPFTMNVVGFDTATPNVMSDFIKN